MLAASHSQAHCPSLRGAGLTESADPAWFVEAVHAEQRSWLSFAWDMWDIAKQLAVHAVRDSESF